MLLTVIVLVWAAPSAGARPPAWKRLMYEAYGGPIHHRYSCATVREALDQIPSFLPSLAVLKDDLRTYQRRVCK